MMKFSTLACFILTGISAVANAAPITWTVDTLLFNDGGTASGSFTYDASTNIYTDISIMTTGGTLQNGATYTFLNPSPLVTPTASAVALVSSNAANLTGLPGIGIYFDTALTSAGGSVFISGGTEGTCVNANCSAPNTASLRSIVSGQLTAVPVPAAIWLFFSGLGWLAWIRRRAA